MIQFALAGDPDSSGADRFRFDPTLRAICVEGATVLVYNFSSVILDADLFRIPSPDFPSIGFRLGLMRMNAGFWGAGGESKPNDFHGNVSGLFARATNVSTNFRVDLFLGYAVEHRPNYYPKTLKMVVGGIDFRWIFVPPVLGLLVRFLGTSDGLFPSVGLSLGYFH